MPKINMTKGVLHVPVTGSSEAASTKQQKAFNQVFSLLLQIMVGSHIFCFAVSLIQIIY